ncbi:MAG: hypothetical protein J6Y02_04110 [Pseudobutyrivibrio sp.]|nr:hypothetical protein [Pseudobutyrivibrio sp.]
MKEDARKQLEDYCKKTYQTIVDSLTKLSLDLFDKVYVNLPDTMSEEEKLSFIKDFVTTNADSIVGSASMIGSKINYPPKE